MVIHIKNPYKPGDPKNTAWNDGYKSRQEDINPYYEGDCDPGIRIAWGLGRDAGRRCFVSGGLSIRHPVNSVHKSQ